DAVAGEVEEADALAGAADLPGHRVQAARLAAERGADVDHGDRAGDVRDVLHRHRLEDVHRCPPAAWLRYHCYRLASDGGAPAPRRPAARTTSPRAGRGGRAARRPRD